MRGPPWTRFRESFENLCRKEKDKFSTIHDTIFTQEDVGGNNGPAHPPQAQAFALNFESVQAKAARNQRFFALLCELIDNQGIVDSIQAHVAGPLMVGGPPAALPGNWGSVLFFWVHNSFGIAQNTGLTLSNQNTIWQSMKLTDNGVNRESIRELYNMVVRRNSERQTPYGALEVYVRFCELITVPPMIVANCMQEMQAPTHIIAGGPFAGQPNLLVFVARIEELWQNLYDRPIQPNIIRYAPPPRQHSGPSNRVDGMHLQIMEGMAAASREPIMRRVTAFDFTREQNCFGCRGYGHPVARCPSDTSISRPISSVIEGLQALQTSNAERLRNFQGRRRIVRRPGQPPPQGGRRQPNVAHAAAAVADEETVYMYDDGSVYSADGFLVQEPVFDDGQAQGGETTPEITEVPPGDSP